MEIAYSAYLYNIFDKTSFQATINRVTKELRKPVWKGFDFVAVSGISGVIIGSIVANRLKKRLIVVRKKAEHKQSHASYIVEGLPSINSIVLQEKAYKYIIIDDFICTGETIKRIYESIEERCSNNIYMECHGLILYSNHHDYVTKHKTLSFNQYIKNGQSRMTVKNKLSWLPRIYE